jgi:hypothetical protein
MYGRLMVLLIAVWVVFAAALIYVDCIDRFLLVRLLLAVAGVFRLALPLAVSPNLLPPGTRPCWFH